MSERIDTEFEHSGFHERVGPSKSQKKRDAKALQSLGAQLLEQSPEFIRDLKLSHDLEQALLEGQGFDRGAKKRQIKFIGRLLRDIDDTDAIQESLANLREGSAEHVREFHRIEYWRDRLLSDGEDAIHALVAEIPDIDRAELDKILHAAMKAEGEGRKKAGRALFRFLRQQFSGV